MAIQHLNVNKAIQAAGVLLRREGKHMSRLRLLKLLYLADRRCLQETGAPILGSKLVAMKHGPLHSEVLDLINGQHVDEPRWSRHFRSVKREIRLEQETPVGLLSKFEIELLNQTADDHLLVDDWALSDLTHDFDEWLNNYPDPLAKTSHVIPIEDVIDAVGRSADKESILQDMQDDEAFDRFFAQ